jgi:hypothetical protein
MRRYPKTLTLLLVLTVMAFCMVAYANIAMAQFTVTWDENVPAPTGYKLFHRWEGTPAYDYDNPHWTGPLPPVTVTDLLPPLPAMLAPTNTSAVWNKADSTVMVDWNQPPSATATDKVYMVVRAYDDNNGAGPLLESADSEEVNIDQISKNDVTKWEVFFSETSGGPYTSLGEVPATGNTRITQPLTVVPVGQAKVIYFTVVAFGQEGTSSPDAPETSVLVDRRTLTPPANITVTATVPVQ